MHLNFQLVIWPSIQFVVEFVLFLKKISILRSYYGFAWNNNRHDQVYILSISPLM